MTPEECRPFAEDIRTRTGAELVIVIIVPHVTKVAQADEMISGGSGIAVATSRPELQARVPRFLRHAADRLAKLVASPRTRGAS